MSDLYSHTLLYLNRCLAHRSIISDEGETYITFIHFTHLLSPVSVTSPVHSVCVCVFIPLCVCIRHRDRAAGVFSRLLIMASLQHAAFHARIMNLCLLTLSGHEGHAGISLCID